MRYYFSLHKTKTPKACDVCGIDIPVRKLPDYSEYWKVKGGDRKAGIARVICCLCHALYDLPTGGWVTSPNGRETISVSLPNSALKMAQAVYRMPEVEA